MGTYLDEIKDKIDRTVREGIKIRDDKKSSFDYILEVCKLLEVDKINDETLASDPYLKTAKNAIIWSVCKRPDVQIDPGFRDSEELDGEFGIVLFECLNDYDPTQNDSFYNYFFVTLVHRFQNLHKMAIAQKRGGKEDKTDNEKVKMVAAKDESLDEWIESGKEGERLLDGRFGNEYTETPERAFFSNEADLVFTIFTNYTKTLMKLIEDISIKESDGKSTERAREELTRNRMFFTDHVVDVFRQAHYVEAEKYTHLKDLMNVWDDILLSCIFQDVPQNAREIMENRVLLGRELEARFEGTDADKTFRSIFEKGIKLDEDIKIPVVNKVFIASMFIREMAESGKVPKPMLDASISRSRSKFADSLKELVPDLRKLGYCE